MTPSLRDDRRWVRFVPNLLSTARLLLAAAFPALAVEWRGVAVVAAGLTDWLDGHIARRFDVRSTGGGLLDGIADKLFTLSVLLTLAAGGGVGWWQVAVVMLRDLAVAVTALYVVSRREWTSFALMVPRPFGKATTLVLFGWFVWITVFGPGAVATVLFAAVACSSAVAAIDYIAQFAGALRERARGVGAEDADRRG